MATCREEAIRWVHRYAAGGAAVAALPLPISTTATLAALETHMFAVIGDVYGDPPSGTANVAAGGTFAIGGQALKLAAMQLSCLAPPLFGVPIRIAIAASFAPIHARNNVNQGMLMADHALLERLQDGEAVELAEFTRGYDRVTRSIVEHGGLFPFSRALAEGRVSIEPPATSRRPMTMAEKIGQLNLRGRGDDFRRLPQYRIRAGH